MAATAIAVSFFVMIVAVAVSAGFRREIRDGIAALAGDVTISPYESSGDGDPVPMPLHLPSEEALRSVPGVRSLTPSVLRPGIVKSGDVVHGVLVKGVERADSALTVSVPERLAALTGLGVGDEMVTYFVGEKVRVRKFRITALHRDVVEMDDNLVVYDGIGDLQRLNGWQSDEVSCLDVRLQEHADPDAVAARMEQIFAFSGFPEEESLMVTTARRSYRHLFDWLDVLDFNVLVILLLMTLVAGFNMVSGLLIMLLRNISTVGILKTMGMDNRAVGRLFVRIGAEAVLKGMLVGNALALLFCLIQGTTHLIPLDPANYFVSWVPVHVNLGWILLSDAAAFAAILLLLLVPARIVARIDPATTVKAL